MYRPGYVLYGGLGGGFAERVKGSVIDGAARAEQD